MTHVWLEVRWKLDVILVFNSHVLLCDFRVLSISLEWISRVIVGNYLPSLLWLLHVVNASKNLGQLGDVSLELIVIQLYIDQLASVIVNR